MRPLPKLRIFVPCWKLIGEGQDCHWEGGFADAEVITLHLEADKMRVRYLDLEGNRKCLDIPIDDFSRQYEVVEK